MCMGIFDLPPDNSRLASKNIFQIGNIYKKYIAEPDYYICYQAGYWARWLSIFFAVIIFSIVLSHHHFGFFQDIMSYSGSKNYLELYVYLINFTGYVFPVLVAYYLYWFFKVIDFKEYNIFRDILPPGSTLDKLSRKNFRNLSVFISVVSFIATLYPGSPTTFFYKKRFDGYFEQYFDDIIFIFFVAIMLLLIQCYAFVTTISCILFSLYNQYEIKNNI